MKFFLISDNEDTAVGLRLAGIEGIVTTDPFAVEKEIHEACQNPEIGVLLLTHKLMIMHPELIYKLKLTSQRPLIVEISDRFGEGRVGDAISKYVKEVIGIKID